MLSMDFMMFGMFDVFFNCTFFGIFFIFIIVFITNAAKVASRAKKNSNTYVNNQNYNVNTGQSSKYQTINSHYSQETLNGTGGQGPIQPVQNGTFRTDYAVSEDHNHAYEHKVQPIEEASVHDMFEERKQAYRERKAEMKADLPKTSYSEAQSKVKGSNGGKYRDVQGVFAKNGDNGAPVAGNEALIVCSYCGAKNIIPRSRRVTYKCYFCRQEV